MRHTGNFLSVCQGANVGHIVKPMRRQKCIAHRKPGFCCRVTHWQRERVRYIRMIPFSTTWLVLLSMSRMTVLESPSVLMTSSTFRCTPCNKRIKMKKFIPGNFWSIRSDTRSLFSSHHLCHDHFIERPSSQRNYEVSGIGQSTRSRKLSRKTSDWFDCFSQLCRMHTSKAGMCCYID